MVKFLFRGGDATGILAFQNVGQGLGQVHRLFLHQDAFLDDVDGDAGVHVAQNVQIHRKICVDLDDVLFAHLEAARILDDGNGAIQLAQAQKLVDLHAVPCGNMVDDKAVANRIDVHIIPPPEASESAPYG